jgi:hypothetical protein
MRRFIFLVAQLLAVVLAVSPAIARPSSGAEPQWNVTGTWEIEQSNTYHATWSLTQTGTTITGHATISPEEASAQQFTGNVGEIVKGSLVGDKLDIVIRWPRRPNGVVVQGEYRGTVEEGAQAGKGEVNDGVGFDVANPSSTATWTGSGDATCEGDCGSANVAFKFAAKASHPSNIASPFGRHNGWIVSAASIGPKYVYSRYAEDFLGAQTVDVVIDFRVVRTQLRENKAAQAKVLTLSLVATKVEYPSASNYAKSPKITACQVGAPATMVVTDDKRLVSGGSEERGQTRDEVVVTAGNARCSFLDTTYTNADSSSVTPFVGGPKGSGTGNGQGGQWAIVDIT